MTEASNQEKLAEWRKKRKQKALRIRVLFFSLIVLVLLCILLLHNLQTKKTSEPQEQPEEAERTEMQPEDEISQAVIDYLGSFLDKEAQEAFLAEVESGKKESGFYQYEAVLHSLLLSSEKSEHRLTSQDFRVLSVSDTDCQLEMLSLNDEEEYFEESPSQETCRLLLPQREADETSVFATFFTLPKAGGVISALTDGESLILLTSCRQEDVCLKRAFITNNMDQEIELSYKGCMLKYEKPEILYGGYLNFADITLEDGAVSGIEPYLDKVNGKLLSVRFEDDIWHFELAGQEYQSADQSVSAFRLYDEIAQIPLSDLIIGYDFTDLVLDKDGKVAGALLARKADMTTIRVVLKTDDFAGAFHTKAVLFCDTQMTLRADEYQRTLEAGEEIEITADSELFEYGRLVFTPNTQTGQISISSIKRSQGTPSYRGRIELQKRRDGIVIVNELPLDEYLYSVVPSEMPSSYPAEALKAQAVSARTYAYMHMVHAGMSKYGAHVDDSAAFQVYNNCQETGSTTSAVVETTGQILMCDGQPVTTYFYSTSCGLGTDLTAWQYQENQYSEQDMAYLKPKALSPAALSLNGDEAVEAASAISDEESSFAHFIRTAPADYYESGESYFRWKYETDVDEAYFYEQLKERYAANSKAVLTLCGEVYKSKKIQPSGKILSITVAKRAPGGAVSELIVQTENKTYKVLTEKNARYLMAGKNTMLMLGADYAKEGKAKGMLPSAFFTIEPVMENDALVHYVIYGGGFGHGIGMSQNGAKNMALGGLDYEQILAASYQNTTLDELKPESTD